MLLANLFVLFGKFSDESVNGKLFQIFGIILDVVLGTRKGFLFLQTLLAHRVAALVEDPRLSTFGVIFEIAYLAGGRKHVIINFSFKFSCYRFFKFVHK